MSSSRKCCETFSASRVHRSIFSSAAWRSSAEAESSSLVYRWENFSAFCRATRARPFGLYRDANTVTMRMPTITSSDVLVSMVTTGTFSPPLMNGRLLSCSACRMSLTPMKPRMADSP